MTCYECLKPAIDLSPRSRCAECEWRRAIANEEENSKLRYEYSQLIQRYDELVVGGTKLVNSLLSTD